MKKIFSLIVILVAFSSCQEDVQLSNPGFQAFKDDVMFKGIDVKAYKSTSGALRIVALAQEEEIELRTVSSNIGTYYLGSVNDNTADYNNSFDDLNLFYSSSDSFGPILNIANLVLAGGTGYTAGTSVETASTGGSGMKVNTTVTEDGAVSSVKIAVAGSGYGIGDIIVINGGDNKAKFKILSEIVITDNSNNTVTGTFKFNARRLGTDELVNFQYGAFYKIPVIPEL